MVRFDKPCRRVKGAVEYFREHMGIGDYLAEGGKAAMTWFGAGAEQLGLRGRCRQQDFERLCRRQHPLTGQKLTVRERGSAGRVCFFGQISAPKDVSLLCLVGGDDRIRKWWEAAVADTLTEIEATALTRVRGQGADEDRPTGNLVAAVVTHESSRKLDPQLHTHVCILNATFDPVEKRWKSLQPSGLYRHQGFFREVCYAKLAERLRAAGYELESSRPLGFTIKGVPAELREKFSQRRAQILREATARGALSQDALQAVASNSRAVKVSASTAALRDRWLREAGTALQALRDVMAGAARQKAGPVGVNAAEALQSACNHLFERHSVVGERELLREALIAGRGQTPLKVLRLEMERQIQAGDLLRQGEEVASREMLAAEQEFVAWANNEVSSAKPIDTAPETAGLDQDQAVAVKALLASSSRVVILQGDAGTGKTTCLRAVVAGIEKAGGQVFGCAPSSGAADVLRRELTPQANTLQQLLVNRSLQEEVRGRVLIVDEAGLISTRQMRDLCRIAQAKGCRLLLVGDTKQHSSVEAGDALRCLQEFSSVPSVRLTKIRRQTDAVYREAVALLAKGQAVAAFNQFVRLGAVHEIKQPKRLYEAAAADYVKTIKSGKSCLAISPVWSEIHAFTAEVRAKLKAASLIARNETTVQVIHSLGWTREQMRRAEHYQPGDEIIFRTDSAGYRRGQQLTVVGREKQELMVVAANGIRERFDPRKATGFDVGLRTELAVAKGDLIRLRANCKEARLKNGDVAKVSAVDSDGTIRLVDGRAIPAGFREFSYGYGSTSHASQGKTVSRGILLMAEAGVHSANFRQSYVSNSRFQNSQGIYTISQIAVGESMQRLVDRKLSSELLSGSKVANPQAGIIENTPQKTGLNATAGCDHAAHRCGRRHVRREMNQ